MNNSKAEERLQKKMSNTTLGNGSSENLFFILNGKKYNLQLQIDWNSKQLKEEHLEELNSLTTVCSPKKKRKLS